MRTSQEQLASGNAPTGLSPVFDTQRPICGTGRFDRGRMNGGAGPVNFGIQF